MYEIENRRVDPKEETVKKLENALGVRFRIPYEMKYTNATYLKPRNEFQGKVSKEFSRIGIDNSAVYSAPFEIVGKEEFSLITRLSNVTSNIKREATVVKNLSRMLSSRAIFVAGKSHEKSVEGVPVFLHSELSGINSSKELSKVMIEKVA